MDAKSKANFINSVASGEIVPCPECGAQNKPGTEYCVSCGSKLEIKPAEAEGSAFPVAQTVSDDSSQPVQKVGRYREPESVFADGLPSWDIVPPQIMVRRH